MFHTSARKRALVAAIALAVAASGAAAPTHADDLKDKRKKVQTSIKGASSDLDESSHQAYVAGTALLKAQTQLKTAKSQLGTTQEQLSLARDREERLQLALVRAKRDLAAAKAALVAAKAKVAEQRAAVGRLAAQSVQKADPQLVGLVALFDSDSPSELNTEMQTTGNMLDKQDQVLDALRRAQSRLSVQKAKVQQATDLVAEQRQAAADTVVEKKTLVTRAAEQEKSVAKLVAVRASAKQDAEQARSADKVELSKLKKENDRISSLLAARAAKARSYGNTASSAGTAGGGGSASTGNGVLGRPVPGYVTSPFGYRVHPIYGYYSLHDGTDFHAPCGTPLRAVGNGRVISEYYQSAWGNRLILDLGQINGHGVSVIYNHLSAYRAGTGATVRRGDIVGYAGTTGWSTGCHLHFTVMVDGVPKDPMPFF